MHELILAIVILGWIGRQIYRFAQWAKGQMQGEPPRPAGGLPAAPPLTPAAMPRPAAVRPTPRPSEAVQRTIMRPPNDDLSLVPQPATTEGFRQREEELLREEPRPLDTPLADTSTLSNSTSPLFGATSDLVRAVILQEVLGPPRARRAPPPRPPQNA